MLGKTGADPARMCCDDALFVRCPPILRAALKRAAKHSSVTISGYLRNALIERLRADGISLDTDKSAADETTGLTAIDAISEAAS